MANTYTQILRQGTYAQYKAIETPDANLLYFCTDNGKLFKGAVDFTDSFVVVASTALPTAGVPGKIYLESDTGFFKTYINNAWKILGQPLDAADGNNHTITDESANDHVPSAKNVYLYGQDILAQAVGGTGVVKNVEAGTADGKVKVTKGDNTSAEFVVPGVIVDAAAGDAAAQAKFTVAGVEDATVITVPGVITGAVAGSAAGQIDLTNSTAASSGTITVPGVAATIANKASEDGAFTVTPTTGDAYDVSVSGVVTTPTWNSTTRVLTLPVNGGTAVEVNIGRDLVLKSGYYDVTNKQIVLVLNDDDETEVRVDVADLIDIYTGGSTDTASVDVTNNVITASVKLDDAAGNAIEVVSGKGLRVDLSAYALDENLSALATATTSWGTFA